MRDHYSQTDQTFGKQEMQLFYIVGSSEGGQPSGDPQEGQGSAKHQPVLACEDNLAFMEELPDEQMKLVVTSPPYNLGKDYEVKTSLENYVKTQERVIRECVRLLHPQGSI